MKGLTKRQREIVDFIGDYIAVHNYSPSYREIMKHFGFNSLGSVYKHIAVLKRKGVLAAEKASARSVTLTKEEMSASSPNSIDLPFLGFIASGKPLEMAPQAGKVTVPVSMVNDPAITYVLGVQGDSMHEAGIFNGDRLIVEGTKEVDSGCTAVLLVKGNATLKRYFLEGSRVRLEEKHPSSPVTEHPKEEVQIQGILKGLLREYI